MRRTVKLACLRPIVVPADHGAALVTVAERQLPLVFPANGTFTRDEYLAFEDTLLGLTS